MLPIPAPITSWSQRLYRDMDIKSAYKIQSAVNAGEVSAREVAEVSLQRIEETDERLGVFITVESDRVRLRAEEIDRTVKAGPAIDHDFGHGAVFGWQIPRDAPIEQMSTESSPGFPAI